MSKDIFGTDGLRGTANRHPMTAESALKLGMAISCYYHSIHSSTSNRVVISKDPRISGYMFENAITAGVLSMGKNIFLLGPMPTPGLAFLTHNMRADFGIMISASHNLYFDNGIKIFDKDGYKLNEAQENEIKKYYYSELYSKLAPPDKIGKSIRLDGADGRYVQYIKHFFPDDVSLKDLKIVIDCANGAGYKVAPTVLFELGAQSIHAINIAPNGVNINDNCGATHMSATVAKVLEVGADVGISLDGDGDRVLMVDEHGKIVDGDTILAIIAKQWVSEKELINNTVVGTVMSNLGLENYLGAIGLRFVRVSVGDKNIIDYIRSGKASLGGENSGHIVLGGYSTTSDALLACVEVLRIMTKQNKPLSWLADKLIKTPQTNVNVVASKDILIEEKVEHFIAKKHQHLKKDHRLVIRASGTEPLIRIMVEGDDTSYNNDLAKEISLFIKDQQKNLVD